MSRKEKKTKEKKIKEKETREEEGRTAADYYKLHTRSVEDLITADVSNSPVVPEAELRKYKSGHGFHLPERVKLLFIKFWFPAAVCYFFLWGLSAYVTGLIDLMFITGIALGVITDLLTNNAIRFFASVKGANDRYMMFPKKSFWTYPLNIVYAWLLLFLVVTAYDAVNRLIMAVTQQTDTLAVGVEPILFGLLYVGFDTLLIAGKHLLLRIVEDAKQKAAQERG